MGEQEAMAAAKLKELQSVKMAAESVEEERQTLIVNGEPIPEPIVPKKEGDEAQEAEKQAKATEPEKETAPVALQPPQTVVEAMKEVGVKNGISVSVEEVSGSNKAGSVRKPKNMASFKESRAKMKEKMAELSVKAAAKKATIYKQAKSLLDPNVEARR